MNLSIDTLNIIDAIIQDIFNRYQIINLSHEENLYISDKRQLQIIQEVFTMVMNAISNNILERLSLIYKKEYIEDIIAQRVQMVVLQFVIDTNGSYSDTKEPII